MNKDRKLVFGLLALLVGIVAVSISYAAFTQNLNINGTANVQANSWSVHFANLSNGVRGGTASEIVAPTIKASRTDIGDYSVKFFTPGDSITYTFDVVNDGDYDAKISVLTKGTPQCGGSDSTSNTNVCNNLEYTLTYTTGGQAVAVNDTLKVNETKNMTLVLRYKSTIGQNELPTAEVTVSNLGITLQYAQDSNAGGNPEPVYLYSVSTSNQNVGDSISVDNTTIYDDYTNIVYPSVGSNVFLRHTMNGNVISSSEVGFIYNDSVYYLTQNNSDYATNKATLVAAFGASNCSEYGTRTECNINSWTGIANASTGQIIDNYGWRCYARDNSSYCLSNW